MHRVWNPFRDRWRQLLLSCSNEANLTVDSPSPELVKQGKSASGLSEGKRQRTETLPSCSRVWLAFAHYWRCGCLVFLNLFPFMPILGKSQHCFFGFWVSEGSLPPCPNALSMGHSRSRQEVEPTWSGWLRDLPWLMNQSWQQWREQRTENHLQTGACPPAAPGRPATPLVWMSLG